MPKRETATTTPGEVLHQEHLEPLGLTQNALADHLSERDEHDGRAGKEEAGAPKPDAAVQISGSPEDEVPAVQRSVSPNDESNVVQISGSPAASP
jgi:hypothetical protein